MPKGGIRPRTELDALREYANSLGPQLGFFSTLDELIQQAPFERAPVSEWRNYLTPGRMLKREGIQFPLKGEELEWSEIQNILTGIEGSKYPRLPLPEGTHDQDIVPTIDPSTLDKEQLLLLLRGHRPEFALDVSAEKGQLDRLDELVGQNYQDPSRGRRVRMRQERFGPRFGARYSHQSPGSSYEESATRMPHVVNDRYTHFTPDTLSWGRSSSHTLPTGQRVRLVEELQSDPHERAAEKIEDLEGTDHWVDYLDQEELAEVEEARRLLSIQDDEQVTPAQQKAAADRIAELFQVAESRVPRRGYHTREDARRYSELSRLNNEIESDPLGALTDEELEFYNLRDDMLDEYARTGRLYGYDPETGQNVEADDAEFHRYLGDLGEPLSTTPTYEQVFDQLNQPLQDLKRESRTRAGWTDDLSAELKELSQRVERGVLDAPFKDVKEYSALELRKQLLDAVAKDQDYLALARGQDQIDRYGFEEHGMEKQAKAMRYVYDTLLPSVLRKLGARYGATVEEITLPVGTQHDLRPAVLRATGAETVEEFYANLVSEMENPQRRIDSMRTLLRQLQGGDELNETNQALMEDFKKISTLDENLKYYDPSDEADMEAYTKTRAALDDLELPFKVSLDDLWKQYEERMLRENPGMLYREDKTFPALRLTPEVRERIKRIGVPLFSVAGGTVLFNDETEGQEFAEGGRVRSELDDLKRAFEIMNPNAYDALSHFPHGLRTQWMGLDKQGTPRSPIYSDTSAPRSEWVWNDEAQMLLPPQRTVRPGIVDETLALPAFFGYEGFDTSNQASERVMALDDALRAQHNVPIPESWGDYIGEAGGVMSGQIPMPSGLFKGALGKYVPNVVKKLGQSRPMRIAGGVLGSIPEWFMPTIEPRLQNYALGTAAGAVLTKYLPEVVASMTAEEEPALDRLEQKISSSEDELDWSDPNLPNLILEGVESGDISLDVVEEFLREYDARSAKLEFPEEGETMKKRPTYTTGGEFAKGGRVKPPALPSTDEIVEGLRRAGRQARSRTLVTLSPEGIVSRLNPEQVEILRLYHPNDLRGALADEVLEDTAYSLSDEMIQQIHSLLHPEAKAKGGKVITGLRQRLADLIAPAKPATVEGTGREMVPVERVDPATGEPLEALDELERRVRETLAQSPEIARPPEKPRGTVSRRDVLRGMGHLAGAAVSPVKVDPTALLDEAAGPIVGKVEPDLGPFVDDPMAAAAKGLDPSTIADKLVAAFDLLDPEHSDGPYFDQVRQMLKGLPADELFDEIHADLDAMEGDWKSGMIESGEIPDLYETWRGQVAEDIENYAKNQGLIVWARHGDSTDEPMNIMTQRDAAGWEFDNYMGEPELRKGKPELTDEQYAEGEELFHQLRSGLRRRQQLEQEGKLTRALEEEIETEAEQIVKKLDAIGFDSESWGADMDSYGNLGEHY